MMRIKTTINSDDYDGDVDFFVAGFLENDSDSYDICGRSEHDESKMQMAFGRLCEILADKGLLTAADIAAIVTHDEECEFVK